MGGEWRNLDALRSGLGVESHDFVCIECRKGLRKGGIKADSPGS